MYEMKLTIDQVAKLTGLSVSTVRAQTSKQHLGTKVGNKRSYTQGDVQKLIKSSGKRKTSRKPKDAKKQASRNLKTSKSAGKQTPIKNVSKSQPTESVSAVTLQKKSFWAFIFPRARQKAKVSLLEVKHPK
jgi:DNA-binding transcriptional MerR regulator